MSNYLSFLRDKVISSDGDNITHIAVLGLSKSGKSTTINRLIFGTVSDANPPQSICFINVYYGTSLLSVLEVDEETARESPYFQDILEKIDGVVFVIDAKSKRHVETSFQYIYSILDKIPRKTPILLLANKQDIEGSVPLETILLDPAFQVIISDFERSVSLYDISAKTGENFYTAFDWLISRMTGRTPIVEEVTVKRVIILQEGGVPVFDHTFDNAIEEHDGTLLGGLISALNIMATTIFESESIMDIVKLGGFKLVIRKMKGLTGVLFVSRDDSESKAQFLIEEILKAFIEEKDRNPEKSLAKETKYQLLQKIPEIAILLDQHIDQEI